MTSCFFGDKISSSLSSKSSNRVSPTIVTEEELISSVGLNSYESIVAQIEQDTGVTALTNNERRDTVENALSTLPDKHTASRFSDAVQKSVFQVAAAYCDQMVATNNIVQSVFPEIGNMGGDLSDAQLQHLLDVIQERFWGGTASPESLAMLRNDLEVMIRDFRDDGLPKTSLVFGACTYASSTSNKIFN